MKKLIALLLVFASLCSVLGLSGCQRTNPENEESEKTEGETESYTHPHHSIIFEHLNDHERLYYSCTEHSMDAYRAIYQETGYNPVVRADNFYYREVENVTGKTQQKIYTDVVVNEYYMVGCRYFYLTIEDYEAIQEYQNRTGRQVIYPMIKFSDRDEMKMRTNNANIYYKVEDVSATFLKPVFDENGDYIPNYCKYKVGEIPSASIPEYNSLRIEGEDGFIGEDGERYYYAYGRKDDGGVEVRIFVWALYQYVKETNTDSFRSIESYFKC
ncbi:MAG: hypothetical protein IKC61_03960 [Clostridia bacterium]|nr:hypothetical protein [Clostridia bacterium]